MRDKINYLVFVLFLASVFFLPGLAVADTQAETIQKLIKMVEAQQRQIDMLKKEVETLKTPAKADASAASAPAKNPVVATKGMAKSGNDKVQLQVYGQVNRAVLVTDDGTSTDLFHVDNNNSSTRIGMKGKAKINDDLTAGTKIEVQFASNSTASVDQDNESAGANNFTKRHLDAYFQSKTWGKVSIGQGDTATNGTSEIDLSGTSVAGYSYAGGVAGGLNFVNPITGNLSGIQISDVMSHMDGLSRNDRFRYDTPSFNGFTLSGSLVEASKRDLALRYSGKMPGAQIAAGVGYAFQDRSETKHQTNGSFSVLLDSGLNFTFAGGMRDIDVDGRDTPYFFYGKMGYKANLNAFGSTNFACDYGRYESIDNDDETAQLFGVYAVQQIRDAGTELYLGYRWHDLDVPGTEYDAIHAAMLGTRIKF